MEFKVSYSEWNTFLNSLPCTTLREIISNWLTDLEKEIISETKKFDGINNKILMNLGGSHDALLRVKNLLDVNSNIMENFLND